MVRRTKEEAQATRDHLLDTAEAMFLQHGVARTSLNDIASAAGLTRGAVYWHFEDKAALYNALMERLSACCQTAAQEHHTTQQPDALAAVRALAWTPLALVQQDERMRRLFTIARHRVEFSEDLSVIWSRRLSKGNEYRNMLERGLQAAQAEGLIAPGLPLRALALGLFALVDGLLTHATLDPSHADDLSQAAAALDSYLAGLRHLA